MEELKYELPHYFYFIDTFSRDGFVLEPKAFLLGFDYEIAMPFGSESKEDEYFDFSQTYYTINEDNIPDFMISRHFLGDKHITDLGDIIDAIYKMDLGDEANSLYEKYCKEYQAKYYKEYLKEVIARCLGTDQAEYISLLSVINERLGSRPVIKREDLGLFMPSISFEMQNRSQKILKYFMDEWTKYYSKNGKKECNYKQPDEMENLLDILEPLDSC